MQKSSWILVLAFVAVASCERSPKYLEPNEYEEEAKAFLSNREVQLVQKVRSKQATEGEAKEAMNAFSVLSSYKLYSEVLKNARDGPIKAVFERKLNDLKQRSKDDHLKDSNTMSGSRARRVGGVQTRALPRDRMANKRKVDAKNLNPDDSSKYLALFFANAALLQPLEISLPLTEEVFMKLFSARDAFIEKALASYSLHTLRHKGKRQEMEIRLSQKEEKTRDLMLKACKEGKGVYRSRLGLDLAMFEALSKEEQEKGLKSGRERLDKMKVNKETLMEMMSAKLKQEDEKLLSVKNVEDWFMFNYNPLKFSLA